MVSQVNDEDPWLSSTVDGDKIASVLFSVSGGDKRRLHTSDISYLLEDSIWGRGVSELFPETATSSRDRLFLFRVWELNRKSVREKYDLLAGKKTSYVRPKPKPGNEKYTQCICEPYYEDLANLDRIQCDKCKRWVHDVCCKADISKYPDGVDFICRFCEGSLLVPPIFEETLSGTPDYSQEHKAGHAEDSVTGRKTVKQSVPVVERVEDKHELGYERNSKHSITPIAASTPILSGQSHVTTPKSTKGTSPSKGLFSFLSPKKQPPVPSQEKRLPSLSRNRNKARSLVQSASATPTTGNQNDGLSSNVRTKGSNAGRTLFQDTKSNVSTPSYRDDGSYRSKTHTKQRSNVEPPRDKFDDQSSESDFEGKWVPGSKQFSPNTQHKEAKLTSSAMGYSGTFHPLKTGIQHSFWEDSDDEEHVVSSPDISSDSEVDDYDRFLDNLERNRKKVDADSDSDKDFDDVFSKKTEKGDPKTEPPKPQVSDEDDDDEIENENPIDTSTIPKSFTLTFTQEEWRKVIFVKEGMPGSQKLHYQFGDDAANALNIKFDEKHKLCNLGFRERKLGEPNSDQTFFIYYARCTNKYCSAKWRFSISNRPSRVRNVEVTVSMYKGQMTHYASKPASRRWTGMYKEKAKEVLKCKMPLAARLEFASKGDVEAIQYGKLTSVKTVGTYSNIKYKMEKENDLAKHIIDDIMLSKPALEIKFPDKLIPGYLQLFQIFPAQVVLYSYRQMELFKALQKRQSVNLFLDATGSLVKNLGGIYDNKRMLLYTVLMKSPVNGNAPIPLCEMISSDNRHIAIFTWLYSFFHAFQRRCDVKNQHFGVAKFEIDFSRPLLVSLVKLFERQPLDYYLNQFWNHFVEIPMSGNTLNVFPVHVCRFHVTKAIQKKIKELFRTGSKENKRVVTDMLLAWVNAIVRAKDLWTFDRRCKDIAVVTLNKFFTSAVAKRLDRWNKPTRRDGNPPWLDFDFEIPPQGSPFWQRTAWGRYCHSIFTRCEEINDEVISSAKTYELNPFFSTDLADYLRTYFLPYFPIISHMVYESCGLEIEDDTNNLLEGYFGLLKTNIYKQKRHQRLSRFIRRQAEVVDGLLIAAIPLLASQNAKKGSKTKQSTGFKLNLHREKYNQEESGHTDDETSLDENSSSKPTEKLEESNDVIEDWNVGSTPSSSFKGKNYETISPDKQREEFKKPLTRPKVITPQKDFMDVVPVVRWGGVFEDKDTKLPLQNTCPIDTSLQVLVALNLQEIGMGGYWDEIKKFGAKNCAIAEAVGYASATEFNKAKTLWIKDVMDVDPTTLNRPGNLVGSEFESALRFITELFPVKIFHKCSQQRCPGYTNPGIYPEVGSRQWHWENSNLSCLRKRTPDLFEDTINFARPYDTPCHCGSNRVVQYELNFEDPPFLVYGLLHDQSFRFYENEMPLTQNIGGVRYRVFAYTCVIGVHESSSEESAGSGIPHFIVKFLVDKKKVVYDGLQSKPYVEEQTPTPSDQVTSVWLVPKK